MFINKKYSKTFFISHCISLVIIFFTVNGVSFFQSNYATVTVNMFSMVLGLISVYFSHCWLNKNRIFKPYNNFEMLLVFFAIMLCGFFTYSLYWLSYSLKVSFFALFIQLGAFLLAFLTGSFRFEREVQAAELRKGVKLLHRADKNLEKGVIYLKEQAGNAFTYKKCFDSRVLETLFRIIKFGYILTLGIGVLFGSGSGLLTARIMKNYIPNDTNISSYHIVMYVFSLIVIPILAYYLPAIMSAIRWWKNLEGDIQDRYGKVVYVWPDEQETSTPVAESKP